LPTKLTSQTDQWDSEPRTVQLPPSQHTARSSRDAALSVLELRWASRHPIGRYAIDARNLAVKRVESPSISLALILPHHENQSAPRRKPAPSGLNILSPAGSVPAGAFPLAG